MKKRVLLFLNTLVLAVFVLSGCSGTNDSKKNTYTDVPKTKTLEQNDSYANLKTESMPKNFPTGTFPLSDDISDKIIKFNSSSDGKSFDLKIVSVRQAKTIVEDYAALWNLDNENKIFIDDLDTATLTGSANGFEVFVNASEQSPELPQGARTYCSILIKEKK